ncbi:hypothetical protein G6O67_006711 [Ophiocordyceps sinensis]|uniref:Cytochrome P450 n=1 Tax=Ophiocordyceps sinensis TaxID=72228 RepID=A0A8H4PL15_9HYPO|nr:hypothetical protein G6O67_006711 [Ophiocordyceps sinensis]
MDPLFNLVRLPTSFMDILSENALLLVYGLLSLYIVRKVQVYARLRHISGPFWAGFSDWPHRKAMLQSDCEAWYAGISEEHGPMARVAPNVVMTTSPDVWAHVTNKPGYKRSDWFFKAMRSEHRRDNVFTQTDVEKHDGRRKQLAPGVSGSGNPNMEMAVNECLEELVHLIRSKYMSSDAEMIPMDLARKLQYFLLDSISAVTLGEALGSLQGDGDTHGYIKSTEDGLVMGTTALALGFSWMCQVPLFGRLLTASPKDEAGFGRFMAACFASVDERLANPTDERSDALASFIRNGVTGDDARSEALIFMTVGAINPLAAMSGILLHVISNARVYALLQREIDDAARHGKAPSAGKGLITSAQAKQLPYLQATIREGMRFWPPVVGLFPRRVPRGGDTVVVDGKPVFLPGGVCVGRSVSAMYRRKDIYGNDADSFRPERWFEPDAGKLADMLLRNFGFALVNPIRPWKTRNTLGIFLTSDMWVHVTERL